MDGEVGVEKGDFFGAIASDQVDHLRDDAVCRESIEAPFVKHLIGAVVARIRTADAGGVGELANATGLFVGVEVREIEGWNWKGIERLYFAVDVMDSASIVLP